MFRPATCNVKTYRLTYKENKAQKTETEYRNNEINNAQSHEKTNSKQMCEREEN